MPTKESSLSIRKTVVPKDQSLLKNLFVHPIQVLDKFFVKKITENYTDEDLCSYAFMLFNSNEHKDLTTLLMLIMAIKASFSLIVNNNNTTDPTKVLKNVELKLAKGSTKDEKSLSRLTNTSVCSLITSHSNDDQEWSELKCVSNTFQECNIFPETTPKFHVTIPNRFKHFVNGRIAMFMADRSSERNELLKTASSHLRLSAAIASDESYWYFLEDFIGIVPTGELYSFISSILLARPNQMTRTDNILSLVKKERLYATIQDDLARKDLLANIAKKLENKEPKLFEQVYNTAQNNPKGVDLLDIALSIRNENLDEEGRLYSVYLISQPLLNLYDFSCVQDQLQVLTFEFIRILNTIFVGGKFPHKAAPLFNTIAHACLTFLKPDEKEDVFLSFAQNVEQFMESICDTHSKCCLVELLMCIYCFLAELIPTTKLFQEKSNQYVRIREQLVPDTSCFD